MTVIEQYRQGELNWDTLKSMLASCKNRWKRIRPCSSLKKLPFPSTES
jgi:hypothetical protein